MPSSSSSAAASPGTYSPGPILSRNLSRHFFDPCPSDPLHGGRLQTIRPATAIAGLTSVVHMPLLVLFDLELTTQYVLSYQGSVFVKGCPGQIHPRPSIIQFFHGISVPTFPILGCRFRLSSAKERPVSAFPSDTESEDEVSRPIGTLELGCLRCYGKNGPLLLLMTAYSGQFQLTLLVGCLLFSDGVISSVLHGFICPLLKYVVPLLQPSRPSCSVLGRKGRREKNRAPTPLLTGLPSPRPNLL